MDWSTVIILAAVTLLDGLRRVPAGALIVRRVLGGGWTVAERESQSGLRLISWWNPLTIALIVPSGGIVHAEPTDDTGFDTLEVRLARVERAVARLRVLGAIVILTIVFGIPAAMARFDAWGLAGALAVAMLLSAVTAVVVSRVMRGSGHTLRVAMRIAAPLLYPFSAPRAAEVVLLHAVTGAAPLMVARELLGAERFAAWVRPQAYDALRGVTGGEEALLAVVGQPALAQIVSAAPPHCGAGERYCARCARVYRAEAAVCAECEGLPLAAHEPA